METVRPAELGAENNSQGRWSLCATAVVAFVCLVFILSDDGMLVNPMSNNTNTSSHAKTSQNNSQGEESPSSHSISSSNSASSSSSSSSSDLKKELSFGGTYTVDSDVVVCSNDKKLNKFNLNLIVGHTFMLDVDYNTINIDFFQGSCHINNPNTNNSNTAIIIPKKFTGSGWSFNSIDQYIFRGEMNNNRNCSFSTVLKIDKIHQKIQGDLNSPECNFRISYSGISKDTQPIITHVMNLTFFFNLITLLEIRQLCNISKNLQSTSRRLASKTSAIALLLQIALDTFETTVFVFLAFSSHILFPYCLIIAILKGLVVIVMKIRYLLDVWRSRIGQEASTDESRTKLNKIIQILLLSVAIAVTSAYCIFPTFPYCIVVLYFFWLPQICWDVWRGQRSSVDLTTILGITFFRLVFPAYIFCCPSTLFNQDLLGSSVKPLPSTPIFCFIFLILSLQVLVMFAQRKLGARFFVSSQNLPHIYDYYRPANEAGDVPSDCVICMNEISGKERTFVITPCDHYFHSTCLSQWMDVKLECPTCRGSLPPLD